VNARFITDAMIQRQLAAMLGWVVCLPQMVSYHDAAADTQFLRFSAYGRKVNLDIPPVDRTLMMEEFAARHLTAAAKALAVA
jgi:hypothetical protein